jgi:hypothetical protein
MGSDVDSEEAEAGAGHSEEAAASGLEEVGARHGRWQGTTETRAGQRCRGSRKPGTGAGGGRAQWRPGPVASATGDARS